MAEKTDVVVIGAGVVGCSIAYYLAREGIKVALLERESIGSGSSAHATGFISLLGTEFTPGPILSVWSRKLQRVSTISF